MRQNVFSKISLLALTFSFLLSGCKKENNPYIVAVGFVQSDGDEAFNLDTYEEIINAKRSFYFLKDEEYDFSSSQFNNLYGIVEDTNVAISIYYTIDMTYTCAIFMLSDGTFTHNQFYVDVDDETIMQYSYDYCEDFEVTLSNNLLIDFYGYYNGYRKSNDETVSISCYSENDSLIGTYEVSDLSEFTLDNNTCYIKVNYADGYEEILDKEDNDLVIRTLGEDGFLELTYIC